MPSNAPGSVIVNQPACLHCACPITGTFIHLTAIDRYLHVACYKAAREWFRNDNAAIDAYYARQAAFDEAHS